jgi:WD40 repeat protein
LLQLDATTGKLVRKLDSGIHPQPTVATMPGGRMSLSPDGKTMVMGGLAMGLRIVDVQTGKGVVPDVGNFAYNASIHFSADSKGLWTQNHSATILWDAATGKAMKSVMIPKGTSSDGKTILSYASPTELVLMDAATQQEIGKVHIDDTLGLVKRETQVSPDGRLLALIYGPLKLDLYDTRTGKLVGHRNQ